MPQRELKFLLRFKSDLRALQKARGSFKKLAGAVRTVGVQAKAVAARMLAATASLKRFGAAALKASAAASAGFTRLTATLVRVGGLLGALGIGIGLGVAVQTVVAFGVSMSRVQAITGELERDLSGKLNPTFQAISETVRQLGATTVFTASQAAGAFGLLAQAGFDAGESINAVAAVLDLAVVGAIDLGTSAGFVANAIRAFGLSASEAGRVADVFAATISASNTNVVQLGEALKFVGPIAAEMGISIEEASAAIGTLSNAGLKATLAGTGLRKVLISLAKQTPQATKTLKDAGVNVDALRAAISGGGGLVVALKEFEGRQLSAAQAVEVFGLRGGPAFLVLQRLAKETGTFTEALKQAEDEAKRMAKVMRDNLGGDLKILRSVIEDTILGTGGLNRAFREVTQTVTGVIMVFAGTLDPLDENADKFREIAATLRIVGDAIKVVIAGFVALKVIAVVTGAVNLAIGAFTALAGAFGAVTAGIAAMGGALGIFAAALAATGIGVLIVAAGILVGVVAKLATETDRADVRLEEVGKTMSNLTEITERAAKATGDLAVQQLPGLTRSIELAEKQFKALTDDIQAFRKEAEEIRDKNLFEVFSSKQLTLAQKFEAAFRGFALGSDAAGEAARILGQKAKRAGDEGLGPLEEKIAAAVEQFLRLEKIQKAQEEITKTEKVIESLGKKIGETRKTLEAFADLAAEGIEAIDIQISDIRLPTDLDRQIAKELRKAELTVEVPVALVEARESATKFLKEATEGLARAEAAAAAEGVKNGEALIASAQVRLVDAESLLASAEAALGARAKERKGIIDAVTELSKLTEAEKKLEAAEKAIGKIREEGIGIDEKIRLERERLTRQNNLLRDSGNKLALSDEELAEELAEVEKKLRSTTEAGKKFEQALKNAQTATTQLDAELKKLNAGFQLQIDNAGKIQEEVDALTFAEDLLQKAEARVAQKVGESADAFRDRQLAERELLKQSPEFLRLLALREAALEKERQALPAASKALKTFVSEATNAAKLTEQAFSTAFSALDTQLKSFIKTGVFDFRQFALEILDEIALLAAKAAIATALKPVLGVAGGGGGGILDIVRQGLGLAPGAKAAPAAAPGAAAPAGAAAAAPTGIVPRAPDGGGFFGGGVDFAGLQAGISGIQQGIQQQQTVEALKVGFATLIDLSFQQLEQDIVLQEELIEGLGGAIRGNGGMVSQTFKDNLAKLEAGETENATQARLDALKTQQETQGGAALMANAVDVAGSKQLGVLRIMQTALLAIQLFQAIIAAFAILPFPFAKGGVTTKGMAGGRRGAGGVNPSVFLGARRFQAGGISDEDTIPALLKPEEAIIPLAGGAVPVQITPSGDQAPTREPRTIQVAITVNANDAESFVESQQEIATKMAEEIRAAEERNR